jgi:hypothetical protein
MKKRLLAGLLAAMMVVSMMATTAFAAGPGTAPEVYSVTVDMADLLVLGADSKVNKVDVSLVLGGYQSGWSTGVRSNFVLPSTATVVGAKVTPGRAVAGGPITSVIAVSKFKLTAPNGTSAEVSFKSSGAETSALNGAPARGYWTLSMYGQNIGPDLNTVKYAGTSITIYYTV